MLWLQSAYAATDFWLQLEEMQELFQLVDKDGEGSVDEGELRSLLKAINVDVPQVFSAVCAVLCWAGLGWAVLSGRVRVRCRAVRSGGCCAELCRAVAWRGAVQCCFTPLLSACARLLCCAMLLCT